MKHIHKGFTLIELLVVIVILGILATLSFGSFRKYFGSANDAARMAFIKSLALDIKATYVATDQMYIGEQGGADGLTAEKLQGMMKENDLEFKPRNNICVFVGVGSGETDKGSDNQMFVASWGETQSTGDSTEAGVLVDGTLAAKNAMSAKGAYTEQDFNCSGGAIQLPSSMGTGKVFKIESIDKVS